MHAMPKKVTVNKTWGGGSRVLIFGADSGGVTAFDVVAFCGWKPLRFINMGKSDVGSTLLGLPVVGLEGLQKRDYDLVIVSTLQKRKEATKPLEDAGLRHGVDYFFADEPVRLDGMEVRLTSSPVVKSDLNVVFFGSGEGAVEAFDMALQYGWNVVYIVDNNSKRWGEFLHGVEIKNPDALNSNDFDIVVVCSLPGKRAIFSQLKNMGYRYRDDFIFFRDYQSETYQRCAT